MSYKDELPGESGCRTVFASYLAWRKTDEQHKCELCQQVVKMNKTHVRGRYGLLQGCNHAFCLTCIREHVQKRLTLERRFWRTENLLGHQVLCPACKAPSLSIMASESLITDPKEKAEFISKHQEALKDIKCGYFRRGFGACFCVDKVNHDHA